MCMICVELIKQRMTLREARNAATELTAIEGNAIELRNKGELEHVISLLESIEDSDFQRLEKVLSDGTEEKQDA